MMGMKRKPLEDIAEQCCFMCKDGGEDLRTCDFKNCLKAYHPHCLGKGEEFLDRLLSGEFICDWHKCVDCKGSSDYQCLCCPIYSVCHDCIEKVEFVQVRKQSKGFCQSCLNLAILMEKNGDGDPHGAKNDDTEKHQILFKDYWEVIKDRERLTLVDLQEANVLLNRSLNRKRRADSEKFADEGYRSGEKLLGDNDDREQTFPFDSNVKPNKVSSSLKKRADLGKSASEDHKSDENLLDDNDDSEQTFPLDSKGKPNKVNTSLKRRKSNKKTYVGWATKELIEFLSSSGKDTTKPLDEFEVVAVIKEYINQENLFKDNKKKSFICDDKLRSLFRRKKLKCSAIHRMVEMHLEANELSEDESLDNSEDGDAPVIKKKPRNSLETNIAKRDSERNKTSFASLIPSNLKLIYLRRSLVIKLLSHPDTFEQKVVGCCVRVKTGSHYLRVTRHAYLVGLVTGIKKSPEEYKIKDTYTDILLCVTGFWTDVEISLLSDEDFDEDECSELIPLVEKGLLKRPTVAELEEKVATVHSDIVNHWIDQEIPRLEKRINNAHEKGWHREMNELMRQQKLLETPAERQRRLEEVPEIIADMEDEKKETELKAAAGKSSQENKGKKRDRASSMVDMEENSKGATEHVAQPFKVLKEKPSEEATQQVPEPFGVLKGEPSKGTTEHEAGPFKVLEEKPSDLFPETTQGADSIDVAKEELPRGETQNVAEPSKLPGEKPSEGAAEQGTDALDMLSEESPKDATEKTTDSLNLNKEVAWRQDDTTLEVGSEVHEGPSSGFTPDSATHCQTHTTRDGSTTQAMDIEKHESNHSRCNEDSNIEIINLDSDEEDVHAEHQEPEHIVLHAPRATNGSDLHMEKKQEAASRVALNDLGTRNGVLHQEQHKQVHAAVNGMSPLAHVWHYTDPKGEVRGPFPLLQLFKWNNGGFFDEDFKVWRTGQTAEQAILLTDAFRETL